MHDGGFYFGLNRSCWYEILSFYAHNSTIEGLD